MSGMQDLGFRLFGRNIQLGPRDKDIVSRVDQDDKYYNDDYGCISSNYDSRQGENRANHEKTSRDGPINTKQEEKSPKTKKGSQSTITDDTKTSSNDKECSSQDSINVSSNDQTSSTNPEDQKPLQKPDKILPCPRCNSLTTKFCYFNNYNVHQPRHFCKDCQRYWTAGGTMRSVPVGSGRRKKKSSLASQNPHLVVPETSFGFVQENMSPNSMFFNKGGNEIPFQGLPPQMPCIFNPVVLRSGFPVSFYSADQSRPISTTPSSVITRKHSRDGNTMLFLDTTNSDRMNVSDENVSQNARIVRAKITNLDDPIEAANSSTWTTLQFKNKHNLNSTPAAKAGFFGHHERSIDPRAGVSSMVMEFNPAAFSRSLSFQEIR